VELNKELFENALSLSDKKLRETTIHRKEIIGIDINSPISKAKDLFVETKLSKLVVFDGNIDNIKGYIHQLDMFKKPHDIRQILLPIPTVPESMAVTDMMNKFTKERKSIAWVVDEFGGTAGIVTMEDLLEEIFGEIKDEYDVEEFVERKINNAEYIFSGRLETDLIAKKYNLEFTGDDELETLSGYIINNHGEIPKQKETIIIGNYQFFILSVSPTRIEKVKLKILSVSDDDLNDDTDENENKPKED
jgi:CBS domain containing-hemolysin-like protein